MILGILLLLAQVPFVEDRPCAEPACFRVAFRQVKKDTIVVLNYPAGARPTNACSVLYERATEIEIGRHCWAPKDDRFEIDLWEGLLYRGVYFEVELWREDGGYVRATPILDKIYESGNQHRDPSNDCGGDDCP